MKRSDFFAPNRWVLVFSILAIVGLVLSLAGKVMGLGWLMVSGLVLVAPLLLGGVLLVLVVIPWLLISNRKARQQRS